MRNETPEKPPTTIDLLRRRGQSPLRTTAAVLTTALLSVCFVVNPAFGKPYREVLPPDLVAKYERYLQSYRDRHLYMGGAGRIVVDDETKSLIVRRDGLGDSQGWTGVAMAAFALQEEWNLVFASFEYWEAVKVKPGQYQRYPGLPRDFGGGQTSIDQYGKMALGLTVAYLTGPEHIKRMAKDVTRDIILYCRGNDWKLGDWGPYLDAQDIRFLFQLMSERMGLGLSALEDGETWDEAREKFLNQFRQSILIRVGSPNYFTLNLHFERLFAARLLKPDLEGLNETIKRWRRAVERDGNALFDWFWAKLTGKDASFVLDDLRDFPDDLPNRWSRNGYNQGYRWQHSPETLERNKIHGPDRVENFEYEGVDFMALASFYSYFEGRRLGF